MFKVCETSAVSPWLHLLFIFSTLQIKIYIKAYKMYLGSTIGENFLCSGPMFCFSHTPCNVVI
jgi:hypothetical protein